MSALQCGVVGLGNMGQGIAANLHKAGLLSVALDSDPEAFGRLGVGNEVSRDSTRLSECDVIVLVVPGSKQIAALLDDGTISAGRPNAVLLDLTTSIPEETHLLAERAKALGYDYVDAGMTGGAKAAASGALTLMAGGETDTLARLARVFDAIAGTVFHLGPVGSGHTMKLVHNMICHTILLATAEGCRAAERAGIPLSEAVRVLNAGNARSFVSERRFPDHIVSETFDGRSHVANLAKDLKMAEAVFAGLGQPSHYVGLTASLLETAMEDGMQSVDFTRLYPAYDRIAQIASGNTPQE